MLCHSTESPSYEDRWIHSLLWWSEQPEMQFLGTSYKTQSQRSQISPEWKLFSHHSSPQSTQSDSMSVIYHNKHIWDSSIFLIELFNEKWSRWYDTSEFECLIKKAYLSCILFHCFIQYLYWMSSGWIHHQSVWSVWTSFIRLSALNLHLAIDKSLKLCIGKFIL